MRKLIVTLMLLAVCGQGFAQEHYAYCTLICYNHVANSRVKAQLDFGLRPNNKAFMSIYDEQTGKKRKFNTQVALLNFMAERGWRVVECYRDNLVRGINSVPPMVFLLEKKITDPLQITEGLNLKEDEDKEPWKPGKDDDDMY